MKKIIVFLIFILTLTFFTSSVKAGTLDNRLKGKILIQTESKGEAWYVHPKTGERYYMANGGEAYSIMRNLGVGITNNDLDKIKANKVLAKKSSGKIFLQVESRGEAYYVDFNGALHYLKDGSEAYNVMRTLGLGITNKDLEKIPTNKNSNIVVINKEVSNLLQCNGKSWLPCNSGKKFNCPTSGDPVCSPSDSENLLSDIYKKDIIDIQTKYIEKLNTYNKVVSNLIDLHNARIGYLKGLSDSNINLLNSSNPEIIKTVYMVGDFYNTVIDGLKNNNTDFIKIQNEINETIPRVQKAMENTKSATLFTDSTYNEVVQYYIKADNDLTSYMKSMDTIINSFNAKATGEDDLFKKYWNLLQISSINESKMAAQAKIQNNYIVQINQYNNYVQSFKPITCHSATTFGLTTIRCN